MFNKSSPIVVRESGLGTTRSDRRLADHIVRSLLDFLPPFPTTPPAVPSTKTADVAVDSLFMRSAGSSFNQN